MEEFQNIRQRVHHGFGIGFFVKILSPKACVFKRIGKADPVFQWPSGRFLGHSCRKLPQQTRQECKSSRQKRFVTCAGETRASALSFSSFCHFCIKLTVFNINATEHQFHHIHAVYPASGCPFLNGSEGWNIPSPLILHYI